MMRATAFQEEAVFVDKAGGVSIRQLKRQTDRVYDPICSHFLASACAPVPEPVKPAVVEWHRVGFLYDGRQVFVEDGCFEIKEVEMSSMASRFDVEGQRRLIDRGLDKYLLRCWPNSRVEVARREFIRFDHARQTRHLVRARLVLVPR